MSLPPCKPLTQAYGDDSINEIDFSTNVNPTPYECTFCTGDTDNNMFFVMGAPGYPGQCRLDQMTFEQIYLLLERNPDAKRDLLKITTDPILMTLANETKMCNNEQIEDNRAMDLINKGTADGPDRTLPLYTLFKGNLGGGF